MDNDSNSCFPSTRSSISSPLFPDAFGPNQALTLTIFILYFFFFFFTCHALPLAYFTFSISISLTFKQRNMLKSHKCYFFSLSAVDLRNEPVSNGFSHSANHFYVFSKAASPSSPLAQCINSSLSGWSLSPSFTGNWTHTQVISPACNESGSNKHPDMHTCASRQTHK